jgi:hypothetical protein
MYVHCWSLRVGVSNSTQKHCDGYVGRMGRSAGVPPNDVDEHVSQPLSCFEPQILSSFKVMLVVERTNVLIVSYVILYSRIVGVRLRLGAR